MKEKIVKDIFYSFLDILLISITGYLFYILMGRLLAPSDYGGLMTIIGLYIIVSPFTALGFNEAITRFIPFLKKNQISSYVKFILKRSLSITIAVGLLIFAFSKAIAVNIYSNELLIKPIQIFSLILLAGTAALLTRGLLVGLKDFKRIFLFDIASQPIRILIPIILVFAGFGIIGGLLGWAVSFFVFFLISLIYLYQILPKNKSVKIDKNIYKYGISSALSASGVWILIQMNILILSVIDLKLAGLFGVALVFGEIMLFLPIILGNVMLPHVSTFFAERLFSRAKRMIEVCLKNLLIFSFPLFIFIYLFSNALIRYIYNPQYYGANIFIFPFTLGCLILSLSGIQLTTIYASGFPVARIKIIWSGVFVNLISSLLFYNLFGPVGIVFGFLTTQILIFIIASFFSYKKVGVSIPRKMMNALIPIGLFSLIIYFIEKFYINFYTSIIFLFFSVIIYFILLYCFGVFDKDDEMLLNMFLKRLGIHKYIYISK